VSDESLGWRACIDEMPDSDETVMIYHPDSDEPVWMGYHDGDQWRSVEATTVPVSHWRPLPEPPKEAPCR
jgi:hypothetical protein